MNCKCFPCFLLVQSLITYVATFAFIPSAGSGPMKECEETSAAKLGSCFISINSHASWNPYHLDTVTFC
jgi:hypothetical protein